MSDASASTSVPPPSFSSDSGPTMSGAMAESVWQRSYQPRDLPGNEEERSANQNGGSILSPQQRSKPSPKSRSLSDAVKPSLDLQSITITDKQRMAKDDLGVTNNPLTPQKTSLPALQLQSRQNAQSATSSPSHPLNRAPLSPKLDSAQIYGSPASVLPRRSRGLDFSRASTNLHHSTLAESSPDSSPTVGGRGVNIPQRRSTMSSTFGSSGMSGNNSHSHSADRTVASSLSSVNMMDSDTSSSDDDDDDDSMNDRDDGIFTLVAQANRIGDAVARPFGAPAAQNPLGDWIGGTSPAVPNTPSFQQARFRNGRRSRHGSRTSGNGSKLSPAPPVLKSSESSGGGYFAREVLTKLHLSDMSDDNESQVAQTTTSSSDVSRADSPRGVIKRPVTRRGNLLPKPKSFARVRAELMEESAPLDSEAKREADVIRQVRESDPRVPAHETAFPFEKLEGLTSSDKGPSHASRTSSGGAKFWESLDNRCQTPPPSAAMSTHSSGAGEDVNMDTPQSTITPVGGRGSPSTQSGNPTNATELRRKRRREDDLDPESFKRRAVSPGVSAQSSPMLNQSSMASGPASNLKRVGLQGMNETNDGLMNMSIE